MLFQIIITKKIVENKIHVTGCVKVLIENGAQVNARDKQGRTPLYYASNYSTADSVRLLLENEANINVFDINSKSSALHGIDDEEKIKVLIEFGANVNAIDGLRCIPFYQPEQEIVRKF